MLAAVIGQMTVSLSSWESEPAFKLNSSAHESVPCCVSYFRQRTIYWQCCSSLFIQLRQSTHKLCLPLIFFKNFAFAIEKWHGGKFSPKQSFSYRYTYKYIQLKYLWNDQCCLPGPRTVCHLASNHTFCHCVTWFLESVLFHTNIVVVMPVIRPGGHAVRSSRMFSILAFIILPEHFYTRSLWLYNFIFFLCHPSLTFLQSTRSTAGMALARQWNSCTPHLSIK